MAFDAHANFGVSSVAVAPSPATTGTSLTVATGEGTRFPAAPFNATLAPAGVLATPANAEIVRVTARSGDLLTITRAQEGSVARAVVVGDLCVASITKKALTDIETMPYARTDQVNTFAANQGIVTAAPTLFLYDSSQPVNTRQFSISATTQQLRFAALDDATSMTALPLYVNRSGDAAVLRDVYEKQRTTPLGHWITVPFNAANFYAGGGMTWTVSSGQVTENSYTLIGKTLMWSIEVGGTLAGTMTNFLYLKTPVSPIGYSTARVSTLGDSARFHDGVVKRYDSTTIFVERTDANAFVAGDMILTTMIILRLP